MKKLNELINCKYDNFIKSIEIDSRKVKPKSLFVAIKGFNVDHFNYIDDAIKNGCSAVVSEKAKKVKVPLIVVKDVNKTFLDICSKFYDKDNWNLRLIGITGTDGKTTTATILNKMLEKKINSAYIGTNGVEYKGNLKKINNTTFEVNELYNILNNLSKEKCQTVCMEASSEALLHNRLDRLIFSYIIVTNVTEDHLNIHKSLENYVDSKLKILNLTNKNSIIILNYDDKHYLDFVKKCHNKVYTYGVNKKCDFRIYNVNQKKKYTEFDIIFKTKKHHFKTFLLGIYNVYNLTASIVVLYLMEYSPYQIKKLVEDIKSISGRSELLNFKQNYKILLDYAHTTNSLKNIFIMTSTLKHKKIITVVGSAGGREKEKRQFMGKIVLENSDLVIFTMDDPRYESTLDIIDDLIGNYQKNNYLIIIDRKEAIKYALNKACTNDLILILGKGRDNYMAIKDEKVKYCDYEVVEDYFANK